MFTVTVRGSILDVYIRQILTSKVDLRTVVRQNIGKNYPNLEIH